MVGLVLLAIVVRLAVGGLLLSDGPSSFVLASDDGDAYDAAARWQAFAEPVVLTDRMLQKWSPDVSVPMRWPQGYWLFLAGQYRLLGSAYLSAVVLQSFIAAGGVLAAYALATHVLPERWAAIAGVAIALSSTGVALSTALYAEALYIPLILSGLALVAAASRPALGPRQRWVSLVLSGGAFALAEATRPLALPIAIIAAVWCGLLLSSLSTSERARMLLALSGGFVLSLAPFIAHDLAASGQVTTFTVGGAEAFRDRQVDEAAHVRPTVNANPYTSGVLDSSAAIVAQPDQAPLAGLMKLPDRLFVLLMDGWAPLGEPLITFLGSTGPWLRLAQWVLAAIGAARLLALAYHEPVASLILLAVLAVLGPAAVLGLPLVRYRAAGDPLLIIAMVAALWALCDLARARSGRRAMRLPAT